MALRTSLVLASDVRSGAHVTRRRAVVHGESVDIVFLDEVVPSQRALVRVIARMPFALRGATSATQTIPLAVGVEAARWRSGSLLVRLYGQTSWPASSSISINVQNVLLAEDSPQTLFSEGRQICSQLIGAATAPTMFVQEFSTPIGPQLSVSLESTYSTTGGLQQFEIGVDLLGRFG